MSLGPRFALRAPEDDGNIGLTTTAEVPVAPAIGLQTYIWNNNMRSIALLLGFPVLVLGVVYAILVLIQAFQGATLERGLEDAAAHLPTAGLIALGISAAWYAIAYLGNQAFINLSTGSRVVTRDEQPELYNLVENLCISRGMSVPALRIIETPARNAFASGLTEQKAVITVTRGILDTLDTDELEAVLAHELSHVRHRDMRLMVIAAVFVGVISVVGEMLFRNMIWINVPRTGPRNRREGGGQAGALILIAFAIIAISYVLAIVVRLALSRRREFLADAGSVELTKNPDAMIRALLKISGHSDLPHAPEEVREMFLDNHPEGFAGLFSTHPPIEARIEALKRYAGGQAPEGVM
jgi:heat shock protein HtpX